MYDNRFGMYPSDDMNDNINSYFGESDTNFFADNSNEQVFGEGFSSNFGDCEMITEAMGFSTTDSDIITEAGIGTDPNEKNFSHDKYDRDVIDKYDRQGSGDYIIGQDAYEKAESDHHNAVYRGLVRGGMSDDDKNAHEDRAMELREKGAYKPKRTEKDLEGRAHSIRQAKPNSTQHRLKALHHDFKASPDDEGKIKADAEFSRLAQGQHGSTLADIHNSGPSYPVDGSPEDVEAYRAEHRRLAAEARAKEAAAKKREDEYDAKARANNHTEEPKKPKTAEEAPKKKKKGFFGLFG